MQKIGRANKHECCVHVPDFQDARQFTEPNSYLSYTSHKID